MPFVRIVKICEIGYQFISDPSIIIRRLKAPRYIFGNLHWKWINISSLLDSIWIFTKNMLLCIKILVTSELPPIFGASFKPLTKLISWINIIKYLRLWYIEHRIENYLLLRQRPLLELQILSCRKVFQFKYKHLVWNLRVPNFPFETIIISI